MKRGLLSMVAMFLCTIISMAQTVPVSGTVVSADDGEVLIGVAIKVKDGNGGTVTDIDGKFELNAPENGTLIVTYIGYTEQEVKVNGHTNLSIKLASDAKSMDEVVVVGYGTVKRKDLTGSVSSVSAKELKDIPLNS